MPIARGTVTGGYSTPLVQALTPYTVTYARPASAMNDYPPFVDSDRLAAYADYEFLVENRPWEVFESLQIRDPEQKTKVALAIGLPELLCNVWADSLYGDEQPPDVQFASEGAATRFDEIWRANGGDSELGWEGVFGTAMSGTGVWKLRRRRDGETTTNDEEIVVEELSPAIFFPRLRRDGRTIDFVTLAWEEDRADPAADHPDLWQVREIHRVDNGQYVIEYAERKTGTASWTRARPDERPEGVDFLPFVEMHAKRWRGRYWGISEIARQLSTIDEIDNRISQIARILDYHGDPLLQVPKSVLFGGQFYKGAERTVGIANHDDADVARYITYDGQIAAQVQAIDKALELAFLTAEVPAPYFGLVEGAAYSGSALRLRLQNYLKKAARYRSKDEMRVREIATMALELDGSFTGDAAIPERVIYGDPLPADDAENAQILTSLVAGRIASRETAVKRLRWTDDPAAELRRIDAEQAADGQNLQAGAGARTPAGLAGVLPAAPGTNPPSA